MLERVEDRFGLKPERLIADTAYGTGSMLGWLVEEKETEPHVPVWDKSERQDGTLSRADFAFDTKHDRYKCPAGTHLTAQAAQRAKARCYIGRASLTVKPAL
jgi:hypothetical protein